MGRSGPIDVDRLPAWVRPGAHRQEHKPVVAAKKPVPTREEFETAWKELGGKVRALARHFGRDRRQIYRWLAAYGLKDSGED